MQSKNLRLGTYEEWRECIEVRCGIPLTPTFITQRLKELRNGEHPKTREFQTLYGAEHLERVIAWFQRAADESPAS